MCECCNSDAEHEIWRAKEMAYWSAYFGDSVKQSVEDEQLLRDEGILTPLDSPETQYQIQQRLK